MGTLINPHPFIMRMTQPLTHLVSAKIKETQVLFVDLGHLDHDLVKFDDGLFQIIFYGLKRLTKSN